jgi:uncharacterized membrane protein HdeD (DUF308 family)
MCTTHLVAAVFACASVCALVVPALSAGPALLALGVGQLVAASFSRGAASAAVELLVCSLGVEFASLLLLPLDGVVTLAFALGVCLLLHAALEAAFAFTDHAGPGRAWTLLSAGSSAVLGVLTLARRA